MSPRGEIAFPISPNRTQPPWLSMRSCTLARTPNRYSRVARVPSIRGGDGVVAEVHVAIRLGPQADATRYRLWQRILEIELAVEPLNLGAIDANLEFMPLLRGSRRVAHPFDGGSLALFKLPQHQIVLE